MKLAATITRSLQADMQAELRGLERAVTIGTRDAGRGLKTELRRQVASAGLGQPRLVAPHRPGLDGSGDTAKHRRMSRAINSPPPPEIQNAPLTPARWADLENVFGDGRSVCGQC